MLLLRDKYYFLSIVNNVSYNLDILSLTITLIRKSNDITSKLQLFFFNFKFHIYYNDSLYYFSFFSYIRIQYISPITKVILHIYILSVALIFPPYVLSN